MKAPSHTSLLLAYAAAVVGTTFLHAPLWLCAALGTVMLLSGRGRIALLTRAAKGVLTVTLITSGGIVVMGLIRSEINLDLLLLLNLRLLLLAILTSWMVRDVDLDQALYRYPAARRWLSIVRIQIHLFTRLAGDYRQAQKSRGTAAPGLRRRYRAAAALGSAALDKAVHNSEALTQGMRSRGAFDD